MAGLTFCVCTSCPAAAEPRAPRHAIALAKMCPEDNLIFLDCVPHGQQRIVPEGFKDIPNLIYETHYFPHKQSRVLNLVINKLQYLLARFAFLILGTLGSSAVSAHAAGLGAHLKKIDASVYFGHNIDTLLPIHSAAKKRNAALIFDCMEFYSDLGNWQSETDKRLIKSIEQKCLSDCDLVIASSRPLGRELVKVYGIKEPLALYNVPPLQDTISRKVATEFSLYWRNAVIDLGQRGLGDALAALQLLPREIRLHIQGKPPADGGKNLKKYIKKLGLSERVFIHVPYSPHEAVAAASRYTVGLCLEQGGFSNLDIASPNKLFDYFMAGSVVVASDLPGLREIITVSKGGLLFKARQADDLAEKIMTLYKDRNLLAELACNARAFAVSEGNLEHEMEKLRPAFLSILTKHRSLKQ